MSRYIYLFDGGSYVIFLMFRLLKDWQFVGNKTVEMIHRHTLKQKALSVLRTWTNINISYDASPLFFSLFVAPLFLGGLLDGCFFLFVFIFNAMLHVRSEKLIALLVYIDKIFNIYIYMESPLLYWARFFERVLKV